MLLLKFISSHRSILIPVLLYGWQDDNVVEETSLSVVAVQILLPTDLDGGTRDEG